MASLSALRASNLTNSWSTALLKLPAAADSVQKAVQWPKDGAWDLVGAGWPQSRAEKIPPNRAAGGAGPAATPGQAAEAAAVRDHDGP